MTTIRRILRDHGIRPNKGLGQSFLEDKNVINKILITSDIREEDTIVEIGAGVGIMTELIAKKARKVIALEIDPKMIDILKEKLAGHRHVDIIQTDVLKYDFSTMISEYPSRKVKVIGNIPYNISSQILFKLLSYRQYISSMILMFQKELGDRLIASPGTRDYGIPTVLVSMYTACSQEMVINRGCFYPQPKVTSSVLKMMIRERPLIEITDHDLFNKIVRVAFSKRRKTLLNNLRSLSSMGYSMQDVVISLETTQIDGKRRAETLTAEELGRLTNYFSSREKS